MAIRKAESQQADRLVQSLAEAYQVTVLKDWEEQLTDESDVIWKGGEWSLDELHILQKGITDLADAMEGVEKFVQHIDSVTISQVAIKHRGLATKHSIRFTSSSASIDTWTVVHELAHVWDAGSGWRLSRALQAYTGGRTSWFAMQIRKRRGQCDEQRRMPGCNRYGYFYGGRPPAGSDQNFNRKEDFAESVAAYVYPSLVQTRVDRFKDDERYRDLLYYPDYTQTRRWAFVDGLFKGTIIA